MDEVELKDLPPYLQDMEIRNKIAAGQPLEGEIVTEETLRGRRPKFTSNHCKMLIEMAAEGKTEAHFRAKVGIGKTCWYLWQKKHKDFKEAVEMADDARKSYIHDIFVQAAVKKFDCNPVLMAKLFDHHLGAPKSSSEHKGPTINVNIDNTGATTAQNKIANLTPEERQEKLEELKGKLKQNLIEEKDWESSQD